jgi:hypothetical protein
MFEDITQNLDEASRACKTYRKKLQKAEKHILPFLEVMNSNEGQQFLSTIKSTINTRDSYLKFYKIIRVYSAMKDIYLCQSRNVEFTEMHRWFNELFENINENNLPQPMGTDAHVIQEIRTFVSTKSNINSCEGFDMNSFNPHNIPRILANLTHAELNVREGINVGKVSITKPELYHCAYCQEIESKNGEFKRCSKCRIVWYCSVKCQHIDWPQHKQCCCK